MRRLSSAIAFHVVLILTFLHREPLQLAQAFRNFEGAQSPWEQVGEGVENRPEAFKLKP